MRKLAVAALILGLVYPLTSHAQQGNETYTVTITAQEVVTIANALAERPYREVQALIKKIDEQISKQITERAKAAQPQGQSTEPPANSGQPTKP